MKTQPKKRNRNGTSPRQKLARVGSMRLLDFVTVRVDCTKEWKAAVCPELECSGFGVTITEALEACGRSIAAILAVRKKSNRAINQKDNT